MSKNSVTRRQFLRAAAVAAAPAVLPASLFGRDKKDVVMPARDRFRKVDEYWAGHFGCSAEDLHGSKTVVVTNRDLAGYDGALVFRHAGSCIVSVPDSSPELEKSKLRAARPAELCDPGFLAGVFGVRVENVQAPVWIEIADHGDFKPVQNKARLLSDADEPAIAKLARRLGHPDWRRSRFIEAGRPTFGLLKDGNLVAASTYFALGNVIAYPGVIVDPAHRGKGLAKEMISASMDDAFKKGLIPMWRRPASNEAGMAVARSLGFQTYASTVVVELVEYNF